MNPILRELKSSFEKHADAKKAVEMSAYMKNNFEFYGIQKPLREKIVRPFFSKMKDLSAVELEKSVRWLWKQPQREFQYFAMELLFRNKKSWPENIISLFEEMVLKKSWWDTVDFIAARLIGIYFTRCPDKKNMYAKKWSEEKNMWMNRTAILFQLKYKDKTDVVLLHQIIRKHIPSDEFFIQKAIGWALREYAYTDEKSVIGFVEKNKLKPLSRREAMKHFG